MSGIKRLSLLVLTLGGLTAFAPGPRPSPATDSTVRGMCYAYYCWYAGQCRYNPECWARGCKNCIQP
jgi:hypothetical protein